VCGQTLRDIEFICIDDASTDNSLEILREYAHGNNRIKVIDFPENRGVSVARNAGIDLADGEYVAFVDADDFVELDFFAKLFQNSEEGKYDIVKGNVIKIDYNGKRVTCNINTFVRRHRMNFRWQIWTAIYKRQLIKRQNIRFPEGITNHEECVFLTKAAYWAQDIKTTDNALYYYCKRECSADSLSLSYKKIDSHLDASILIIEFINMCSLEEEIYNQCFFNEINTALSLKDRAMGHECLELIDRKVFQMREKCNLSFSCNDFDRMRNYAQETKNSPDPQIVLQLRRHILNEKSSHG
jgi:glycosyltransferase involved in cell wall biosynthesis